MGDEMPIWNFEGAQHLESTWHSSSMVLVDMSPRLTHIHLCEILVGEVYGCFRKWWYPQNTPKWSFLVGKPMVVGYHHFRKPPYRSLYPILFFHMWLFRETVLDETVQIRDLSRFQLLQLKNLSCSGWINGVFFLLAQICTEILYAYYTLL